MKFWATLTYVFGFGSTNHWGDIFSPQIPISFSPAGSVDSTIDADDSPVFVPPNGPENSITCRYPSLKGWKSCSTPQDRGCWLEGPRGERYDIHTNYEEDAPPGILRQVRNFFVALSLCVSVAQKTNEFESSMSWMSPT